MNGRSRLPETSGKVKGHGEETASCHFWRRKQEGKDKQQRQSTANTNAAAMPPFAATPPAMFHLNTHPPPDEDEEMDSPVESLSNMSLHDGEAADSLDSLPKPRALKLTRPALNPRSTTDPSPTTLLQGYFINAHKPSNNKPRNRSPYSRSHLRSRSSGASNLSAPLMTRAHSLPNPHIFGTPEFAASASPSSGSLSPGAPHSPMKSPRRVHSPFRAQVEEGYAPPPPPRSPGFASGGAIQSIQEDSELDITPRGHANTIPQPGAAAMASFSRSGSLKRRPASPLHSLASAQQQQAPTSFPTNVIDSGAAIHTSAASSGSSSPSLGPQKHTPERFNEAYPSLHHYASTSSFSSMPSMPSTPTSARSRSPSISSLETIEDAPDLESEAVEKEHIERLKLAAERQERLERGEDPDELGGGGKRRAGSLDVPRGFGFGRVGRERKRWSVCGGERRADLDLETIYED